MRISKQPSPIAITIDQKQLENMKCFKYLGSVLTLQRGVTGTARMLHALTHSSISRQVREQM